MAEKEKRRSTTFVTSRGAIINVAAPSVYIAPGVTPADVTNPAELREELDIHSAFTWEKFLREGVDAHFNGRLYHPVLGTTSVLPSTYWKQTQYAPPYGGSFTLPSGYRVFAVYSKRAFQYAINSTRLILPDWTGVGEGVERALYFGLENGGEGGNGIASFLFTRTAANVNTLELFGGGAFFNSYSRLNVTALLPADYLTVRHSYTVKVHRNAALFYIDAALVGVIQFSPGYAYNTGVVVGSAPYGVTCVSIPVSQFLVTLIEFNVGTALGVDLTVNLSPYNFRVSDGDPEQPLSLPLYLVGTSIKFAGSIIAAGSITSQDLPLFGYGNKLFLLQANQAGTVQVQIRTEAGNWRMYNSDPVTANTLYKYIMIGEAVLGRVVFTPSAYPCTVNDAEVILS